MDLYDVVFEGKILPGKNFNTVKAEFAKLFKILSQQRVNKFFTGHPVVLKKSLTLEQAETYERALLKIGAYCQHKRVQEESSVATIDFDFTPPDKRQAAIVTQQDNNQPEVATKVESIAAIEFEYTPREQPKEPLAADIEVASEQQDKPVNNVSLSGLSLVPIVEKDPGEEPQG